MDGQVRVLLGKSLPGPVKNLMEQPLWAPLSRLTYCAYLIHPLVIFFFLSLDENPTHYQGVWYVVRGLLVSRKCAASDPHDSRRGDHFLGGLRLELRLRDFFLEAREDRRWLHSRRREEAASGRGKVFDEQYF